MHKMIILLVVLFFSTLSFGQATGQNPKQAMEKLAFLAGKWDGSGWQMGEDRQKRNFTQTENITFEVDGEVLLIKGLGKRLDADTQKEVVIHNALAMVSYNAKEDNYDFRSYVASQGRGNHKGHWVKENHFEWFIESPNGKIRFTITLNDKGQWFEKGEFAMGDSWFQFFEMTLDRVEEAKD